MKTFSTFNIISLLFNDVHFLLRIGKKSIHMGTYYVFHKKSDNYSRRNFKKAFIFWPSFNTKVNGLKRFLNQCVSSPLVFRNFLTIIYVLRRKNKTSAQVFRSIIYVRSKRCSLREKGIHFISITLHFMRLCSSTVIIKNSWTF